MPEFGPEEFAAKTGVSRETLSRLKAYADVLADWNARHNLVAKSTLPDLWHRHFMDSAQLAPLIPAETQSLADLGSGAGFPGLVLAVMRPDLAVTLHEATTKKCAFLQAAAERMGIRRQQGGELGAIPEMALPEIGQGAFGHQIVPGVPIDQQVGIGLQPCRCFT